MLLCKAGEVMGSDRLSLFLFAFSSHFALHDTDFSHPRHEENPHCLQLCSTSIWFNTDKWSLNRLSRYVEELQFSSRYVAINTID